MSLPANRFGLGFVPAPAAPTASIQRATQVEFQGKIVKEGRAEATAFAQSIYDPPYPQGLLVLWADGSFFMGRCGSGAVAYSCHPEVQGPEEKPGATIFEGREHPWQREAFLIPEAESSVEAELHAIAQAFRIAVREMESRSQKLHDVYQHCGVPMPSKDPTVKKVLIFSDCVSTFSVIKSPRSVHRDWTLAQVTEIRERSAVLAGSGVEVELRWVPGHSNIMGNELADAAANSAGRRFMKRVKSEEEEEKKRQMMEAMRREAEALPLEGQHHPSLAAASPPQFSGPAASVFPEPANTRPLLPADVSDAFINEVREQTEDRRQRRWEPILPKDKELKGTADWREFLRVRREKLRGKGSLLR